jgi:hypothetical protein
MKIMYRKLDFPQWVQFQKESYFCISLKAMDILVKRLGDTIYAEVSTMKDIATKTCRFTQGGYRKSCEWVEIVRCKLAQEILEKSK